MWFISSDVDVIKATLEAAHARL